MSLIGHNKGPTMARGAGWRRYAWKRARVELLPTLPIEVARMRVRRARELGIDYKAYAGIRAATGRDIIALLFSDNALRLVNRKHLPEDRRAKLEGLKRVDLMAFVHPPLNPSSVLDANPAITRAGQAPGLTATWSDMRAQVQALKGTLPADGVVVVGETFLERDWSEAGRLAGYIPAARYFGS